MDKFFDHYIKSITFAAMALLSETLSGTIRFTARSPQEVCACLDEVLDSAISMGKSIEKIWVFVDVDGTLIEDGSDTESFNEVNNFSRMKIVNNPLVQKLREFQPLPSINFVALTSAAAWGIGGIKGPPIRIDAKPFLLSETKKVSRSKIRADAMQSLGMPFRAAFGDTIRKLPFVLQDAQPIDEIIPELEPFFLSPELEQEEFFSGLEIFHHPHKTSPLSSLIQHDFYVKDPVNAITGPQTGYAKILAWPVYESGVIFSNFLDHQQGWKKGLIMLSFLRAMNSDRSEWPATIIAIDDNSSMLESMQAVCHELNIAFFGIHFNPPTFWIYPVEE
ncbi:MAG: DUF2608 domain-containing protein [Puniceicoccales bacterium]|nr:DUF2608 domain-containing protein [Puniceicoccales bacterium]